MQYIIVYIYKCACILFFSLKEMALINLYEPCFRGDINLVDAYIKQSHEKKCDWNSGLWGACRGGHINLVRLMISSGASLLIHGFELACANGHMDIVQFMLLLPKANTSHRHSHSHDNADANNNDHSRSNDRACNYEWFCSGLEYACEGGHVDIVQLMVSKGADNLTVGFWNACEFGHINVVHFLISKGMTSDQSSLEFSCRGGRCVDVVQLMVAKLKAQGDEIDWNSAFEFACIGGNMDILKFIIFNADQADQAKQADKAIYNLSCGLRQACIYDHIKVVQFLVPKMKNETSWDIFLLEALAREHLDIAHLLILKGAKINNNFAIDDSTIVKLLYLGCPLVKFSNMHKYKYLESSVLNVKRSITSSNVLLLDLLKLVSLYIII